MTELFIYRKRVMIIGLGMLLVVGASWMQSRYPAIAVESIGHKERNVSDGKPFSRFEGDAFGLDKHLDFSALDFIGPFVRSSAIASGDFNNDFWQDIVLGTRKGILLYKNLGTARFVLQEIDIPEISNLNVILAAFVDINNDGWQDVYVTSYGSKNYFILNDKKGFQDPGVILAADTGSEAPQAVSFGDLNKDGYLDFVNGNGYAFMKGGRVPPLSATNKVITNNNLSFTEDDLQEPIGQTLSVLLSDFTNDHTLDLMIGNDVEVPDIFYTGNTAGGFKKILAADEIIPLSAFSTMSMDTADFNNDLYMDIYTVGISSADSFLANTQLGYCFEIKNIEEKQKCQNNLVINGIIEKRDIEQCGELTNPRDKNDCVVMILLGVSIGSKDESLCDKIPEGYGTHLSLCHNYFTKKVGERSDSKEDIPQKGYGNVLLAGSKQGVFQDVSIETRSDKGLWAWNAKFADLDNDEWQDMYVANGRWEDHPPYSNVFFHNKEGQFFETAQEEFNLENFNMVTSYTYIDIDNDGDLDIVIPGLNSPVHVYINNENQNNSITFEFRDKKGNHFGIGNKIYIYYGENSERHQVREIKLGGGFLSFDSPIAHFGLGKYDTVNKIEIVWSTGEKTTIDKEFLANKKYVITRNK